MSRYRSSLFLCAWENDLILSREVRLSGGVSDRVRVMRAECSSRFSNTLGGEYYSMECRASMAFLGFNQSTNGYVVLGGNGKSS